MFNPLYNYEQGKARYVAVSYVGKGSDACFSVRKSNSSYVGNCMKVRRSSDNTTLDIGFSGNDLDTTSLLAFVGAGSGFIETWYDQSGNSRNLVQTTIANQPSIVTSGVLNTRGSRPIIKFDGINDEMNIPSSTSMFINIHYSIGFISAVIGITNLNINNFKGMFGNATGATGLVGFYVLYDDRSSVSRNETVAVVSATGTAMLNSIVNVPLNDIFINNRTCLNIRLDNQNSDSLERSALYANNNYPMLRNTLTNAPANIPASTDFVIGTNYVSVASVKCDVEFQELILFNSEQRLKAVGFKR